MVNKCINTEIDDSSNPGQALTVLGENDPPSERLESQGQDPDSRIEAHFILAGLTPYPDGCDINPADGYLGDDYRCCMRSYEELI
jgi:hypothetical protein